MNTQSLIGKAPDWYLRAQDEKDKGKVERLSMHKIVKRVDPIRQAIKTELVESELLGAKTQHGQKSKCKSKTNTNDRKTKEEG